MKFKDLGALIQLFPFGLLIALAAGCNKPAAPPTTTTPTTIPRPALPVFQSWQPPANPNPRQILDEARGDREAQKYPEALAKHVWYHHNALKFDRAMSGVRLSFALSDWAKLGEVYPPALKELQSIRNETEKNIRERKTSRGLFEEFMDVNGINRTLHEEDKTRELFFWLDDNNPPLARQVFGVAQPALIKAKAYRLCGKYIDPETAYGQLVRNYQMNKQMAARQSGAGPAAPLGEFAEKSFSNGTATLVALMVLNNRKEEAGEIADKALKELDTPGFKRLIDSAREGLVPASWP